MVLLLRDLCPAHRFDAQKKFYSGKKKRHTIKTQIITDKNGEVIAIETGHPGPKSDKTVYKESRAAGQYPQAARRGDLG